MLLKSVLKKIKKEVDDIKSSTNHDDDEMKVSAIDTPGATKRTCTFGTIYKTHERLRRRVDEDLLYMFRFLYYPQKLLKNARIS